MEHLFLIEFILPKEIETLFMTYSYLSIVSYFGILLIVFSLNLKLIQSKIFFTIICILIFITVVYSNTPMMQLLFAICTVMAIVFTIILKKGFLIFVLACIYTLMALIVTINLFNSTLFNVLLNNNLYIVLYINIVLFMAIYYLTGVQACDKISKYFFSLDTISMEKKIDKNDLKNYVYFLYFLLYFSYYVYIFWTNASLSE